MGMEVKRTTDGSETWNKWGRCTAAEIKYLVLNITSKRAAILAVIKAAPSAYGESNELPLKEFRFDGYEGEGNVKVTAVYGSEESGDDTSEETEESTSMSFDCGSGTKHMTHALSQKKVWPPNSQDDADGGIGWNGKSGSEAEFAGVDIPTADMREVWTKYVKASRLTTDYKRLCMEMYGKVNNKPFKGWEAGEVMFLGANFTSTVGDSRELVPVTYNFRISANEKNAKVAGKNIGSKNGWEYVWARSKTENDPNTNTPKVVTEGIYKSEVIEYADFSRLGI